jgi:ubiquinone/menaquinone biosynthesis C-methylase UbiE
MLNCPSYISILMDQSQSSDNVFDDMGLFWAEIADQDQTQRQINFLKQTLPRGGYVLDLACGTGRHTIPLTQSGINAVGLDLSLHLLKIAKERGASQLVRADMRFLPFKAGAFAAVVSIDTSMGYLPSEKEDMQSLEEIKRVLALDGWFILDVFSREYLAAKYTGKIPTPKLHEYPSFYLQQTRTISDNGSQLCDHWTIRTKKDNQEHLFEHTVRLYGRRTLETMLKDSGFTIEAVYGDYELQPYNSTTPRLIILAAAK